jgi:hypothetical protein
MKSRDGEHTRSAALDSLRQCAGPAWEGVFVSQSEICFRCLRLTRQIATLRKERDTARTLAVQRDARVRELEKHAGEQQVEIGRLKRDAGR